MTKNEDTSPDTQEEIDYKAWYEENKNKVDGFDGILANKDKLLGEKKSLQQQLNEYEEKQRKLQAEQGNYKELYGTEAQRREAAEKELQNIKQEIRQNKLNQKAVSIANDLAKGDSDSAALLTDFVERSLAKNADDAGQVEDSVVDTIKQQFLNDKKYARLIGGVQSSGGGAPGGKTTKQSKKFSEMSEAERVALFKSDPNEYRKLRDNK